jgi:hypothetical protein
MDYKTKRAISSAILDGIYQPGTGQEKLTGQERDVLRRAILNRVLEELGTEKIIEKDI